MVGETALEMVDPLQITAPGKMMISGEYAVLSGAPALVASVGLRVRLRGIKSPVPVPFRASLPAEAAAARVQAERACGAVEGAWMLDVSDLRSDDQNQKLGVGSSAAAAAAAAGWVFAAHGHDLNSDEVQQRVFECALAGHRAVAPRGSGADVAASALGGFVRFQKVSEEETVARRVAFPSALVPVVVWTGKQVRTSDMLDKIEVLKAQDPRAYQAKMHALVEAAGTFMEAIESGSSNDVIDQARDYGFAMKALGDASGAPIVEETLSRIAELATQSGGAAKPSGAGGGDVALCLFPGADEAAAFKTSCGAQDLHLLPLELGVHGVCAEAEESKS